MKNTANKLSKGKNVLQTFGAGLSKEGAELGPQDINAFQISTSKLLQSNFSE